MKSEIRKHPWAWVIGGTVVGGLFLSNFIRGGAGKLRRAV